MISAQSTTEIEVSVESTRTKFASLQCESDLMVSSIALDSGADYRPFSPLILKVDGAESALPLMLQAGVHSLEFLGEPFDGTGLLLVGYGVHAISRVSIGSSDAVAAAQLAAKGDHYEGSGPPAPSLGKNGDTYWDTLGLIESRKMGGRWRQI